MFVSLLQVTACIILMIVAVRCHLRRSAQKSAYRILLPYIILTGTLGVIMLARYSIEFFVTYYSGAIYEMEAMSFRFKGPYWWVYSAGFSLPLLPILGILPAIGRRPLMIVFIALLAIIPACFTPIVTLITRVTNQAEQADAGNGLSPVPDP